jgi:hypothetical protein
MCLSYVTYTTKLLKLYEQAYVIELIMVYIINMNKLMKVKNCGSIRSWSTSKWDM